MTSYPSRLLQLCLCLVPFPKYRDFYEVVTQMSLKVLGDGTVQYVVLLSLVVCSNRLSILHRFRNSNTCLEYVTARYLEQSFSSMLILEPIANICCIS